MIKSVAALTLLLPVITGCGESRSSTKDLSTEERFRLGKEALDKGNHQKAQEYFEVILLQDPASEYADDAQFYLAESFYQTDEYRVAAFHYSRVLNDFPGSPFYKQALYMTGKCYYNVSPQYERDQRQTDNAIRQYKAFVQFYPTDSLSKHARERILELRSRLAQRDYSVAQHYLDRGEYKAAEIYFKRVIDRYPDTKYYALAQKGMEEASREITTIEAKDKGS
ncbi:MAG: outer membrane protein assembly factor BamD [Chlorobi bacterium]|nr:outer membrane protein assembly factor BamD [Chlorobiota bacterium]